MPICSCGMQSYFCTLPMLTEAAVRSPWTYGVVVLNSFCSKASKSVKICVWGWMFCCFASFHAEYLKSLYRTGCSSTTKLQSDSQPKETKYMYITMKHHKWCHFVNVICWSIMYFATLILSRCKDTHSIVSEKACILCSKKVAAQQINWIFNRKIVPAPLKRWSIGVQFASGEVAWCTHYCQRLLHPQSS